MVEGVKKNDVCNDADCFLKRRIINNTKYSISGLVATFKNEEAFKIEVFLALVMIPLGFYLGDGLVRKIFLVSIVFFVLIVEILNSAIENLVDKISYDKHELSGRIKDQGSAAVFLSICLGVVVWIWVLFF